MLVVDACPVAVPPKIQGKKLTDVSYSNASSLNVFFNSATADLGPTADALFPGGNYLAALLRAVVKTIKIRIVVSQNGQEISTDYWFAKDVGFVKQSMVADNLNILLELEKHTVKKPKESK